MIASVMFMPLIPQERVKSSVYCHLVIILFPVAFPEPFGSFEMSDGSEIDIEIRKYMILHMRCHTCSTTNIQTWIYLHFKSPTITVVIW